MKLKNKADTLIPKPGEVSIWQIKNIVFFVKNAPCRRPVKCPDNMEQRALPNA